MRILSGIQPTGIVHLGNYFGAILNWVKLQNEGHKCFISIVNQHAITIPQDPKMLRKATIDLAATLIAAGIDPQKSVLFVQSDVSAHTALAWILTCLTPIGQMERMIQFKEKSEKDGEGASMGLLSYPILQAADILLYKAQIVPVGKDQAQHLELSRLLAKKFNRTFKELFPIPETLHTKTTKVVGLDGSAKMSKSLNNYIGLTEDDKTIWKKLSQATTDPARVTRSDPGNPFICNVYSLHTLFSSPDVQEWVIDGCKNAKIGCIDCKKKLFENVMEHLGPIRERYLGLMKKPDTIRDILKAGAERARKEAEKTLHEVYEAIGFSY